jgi:CRISPR-associated protein Cas5d
MSHGITLHIAGNFACFTRPEMKVERVSYDDAPPMNAHLFIKICRNEVSRC